MMGKRGMGCFVAAVALHVISACSSGDSGDTAGTGGTDAGAQPDGNNGGQAGLGGSAGTAAGPHGGGMAGAVGGSAGTAGAGMGGTAGVAGSSAASCAPAPTSTLVANVRDAAYGAQGDGTTNDTAAIQKAVDAVKGTGGTVLIPDGTYSIDAVGKNQRGIQLGSNMTLRLSAEAVLKALPNGATNYSILDVRGISNVNIVGGTLEGERAAHTGTDGEWGMGVKIVDSHHVVVEHLVSKECWGDGFSVGGTSGNSDITLCNVTADHNRRQGLSITNADGVVVKNSAFNNTGGTPPEAGIDIEPDAGQAVNNVQITACSFSGNAGFGVTASVPSANTGQAFTTKVVIDGNTVVGNGTNPTTGTRGIQVSNTAGHVVTNNIVKDNYGSGIVVRNGADNTIVTGNTVTGTIAKNPASTGPGYGILLYKTGGNLVTGNTIENNAGCGLRDVDPTGTNSTTGNTQSANGPCP
jgi:parallel beta-helix repeat protein